MDNVVYVIWKVEGQSREVPVAIGVSRILNLKGKVPYLEESLDEAMKQAVTCPIILPEVYGFSISNQSPSAHITNVLGFRMLSQTMDFLFVMLEERKYFLLKVLT